MIDSLSLNAIRKGRRAFGAFCVLAFGALVPTQVVMAEEAIDEVVLIVNDTAITAKEFRSLARLYDINRSLSNPLPELGTEPTESIINDTLLQDRARSTKMQLAVTQQMQNDALSKLAAQNGMTAADFQQNLMANGVDPSVFKQNLSDRLLAERYIGRRLAGRINVSKDEVDQYIENQPALKAQLDVEYLVQHLYLPVDGDSKEQMLQAQSLRQQILRGEDMAKIISNNPSVKATSVDGILGWKKASQLPDLFVGSIKKLAQGQVSEVISSPNGLHLVKLLDAKGANMAFEYNVRHILKLVNKGQNSDEVLDEINGLKNQLDDGKSFGELAMQYSDDSGSKVKGGELGWIALEQVVPAFASVVEKAELGVISDPVRSRFGYHIIEVKDKRQKPRQINQIERQIQQTIFKQKVDEKIEDLVNDLRQSAFIQIIN